MLTDDGRKTDGRRIPLYTKSSHIGELIKVSSFVISENIRKKEGGPDSPVSNKLSSVTLNELAMKARKRYCNFNIS